MLANEKMNLHTRLGFIGLGYMGSRIARRLVAAGFPMVVDNRDRSKATELAELGAEVAQHPGELAREVDVVLSCLADGPAVEGSIWEQATSYERPAWCPDYRTEHDLS